MSETALLFEKIASDIRKSIFMKEYKAGQELRQEALAEKYQVSRMPIRQALQLLADEDLVTLRKNRSVIVNEMRYRDIQDHFEIRGLLEAEAAVLAVRRGDDFSKLIEMEYKCRKEAENQNKELFEYYNYQFHEEIWRLADSRRLNRMIKQIWNAVSYVKAESPQKRMSVSSAEHVKILEAITHRQEDVARAAMYDHIVKHNLDNFENEF